MQKLLRQQRLVNFLHQIAHPKVHYQVKPTSVLKHNFVKMAKHIPTSNNREDSIFLSENASCTELHKLYQEWLFITFYNNTNVTNFPLETLIG